jgi:hypothetical protein
MNVMEEIKAFYKVQALHVLVGGVLKINTSVMTAGPPSHDLLAGEQLNTKQECQPLYHSVFFHF